jgi:hypothetical protein
MPHNTVITLYPLPTVSFPPPQPSPAFTVSGWATINSWYQEKMNLHSLPPFPPLPSFWNGASLGQRPPTFFDPWVKVLSSGGQLSLDPSTHNNFGSLVSASVAGSSHHHQPSPSIPDSPLTQPPPTPPYVPSSRSVSLVDNDLPLPSHPMPSPPPASEDAEHEMDEG